MARKLSEGTLEILRQRLYGFNAEGDESHDEEIKKMSARDIVENLCGWEIGDESWVSSFIGWCAEATGRSYDEVEKALFG
ncbi:MAG: hypothetical protein IJ640_07245 [Prevotella sp.]|nr:hypothetical protein [Prevotella sp.]